MEIKLGFDPEKLESDSECKQVFEFGGIPLKIWALWKRNHLTNQHFAPAMNKIVDAFRENKGNPPYSNIDEFCELLRRTGFTDYENTMDMWGTDIRAWILKYWDYFNPNLNWQIKLTYESCGPITKIYQPSTSDNAPSEHQNDR